MKAGLFVVCLVAIACLWSYGLWWPKEPAGLPERFQRTFVLYRYEPPRDVPTRNPFPTGQRWYYTFRADGSYSISIRVIRGYEMTRFEGVATLDERETLTLRQVGQDHRENPAEPERYGTRWGQDNAGEYLLLTRTGRGDQLYLRPAEPEGEEQ